MKKGNKETIKKANTYDGDENMNGANVMYPKLDVGLIMDKGKKISSQEALKDIVPINWSDDVLEGKFKEETIIKMENDEDY